MSIDLAVIGGDGIGPEVVAEALKVLDAVVPGVEETSYDLGARRYHATGEVLPDSVIDELKAHDAILLGAIQLSTGVWPPFDPGNPVVQFAEVFDQGRPVVLNTQLIQELPSPEAKAVGKNIRKLRATSTQEQIAEAADMDRAYYAGVELGLRNPSLRQLLKIARALKVPLDKLFSGVD